MARFLPGLFGNHGLISNAIDKDLKENGGRSLVRLFDNIYGISDARELPYPEYGLTPLPYNINMPGSPAQPYGNIPTPTYGRGQVYKSRRNAKEDEDLLGKLKTLAKASMGPIPQTIFSERPLPGVNLSDGLDYSDIKNTVNPPMASDPQETDPRIQYNQAYKKLQELTHDPKKDVLGGLFKLFGDDSYNRDRAQDISEAYAEVAAAENRMKQEQAMREMARKRQMEDWKFNQMKNNAEEQDYIKQGISEILSKPDVYINDDGSLNREKVSKTYGKFAPSIIDGYEIMHSRDIKNKFNNANMKFKEEVLKAKQQEYDNNKAINYYTGKVSLDSNTYNPDGTINIEHLKELGIPEEYVYPVAEKLTKLAINNSLTKSRYDKGILDKEKINLNKQKIDISKEKLENDFILKTYSHNLKLNKLALDKHKFEFSKADKNINNALKYVRTFDKLINTSLKQGDQNLKASKLLGDRYLKASKILNDEKYRNSLLELKNKKFLSKESLDTLNLLLKSKNLESKDKINNARINKLKMEIEAYNNTLKEAKMSSDIIKNYVKRDPITGLYQIDRQSLIKKDSKFNGDGEPVLANSLYKVQKYVGEVNRDIIRNKISEYKIKKAEEELKYGKAIYNKKMTSDIIKTIKSLDDVNGLENIAKNYENGNPLIRDAALRQIRKVEDEIVKKGIRLYKRSLRYTKDKHSSFKESDLDNRQHAELEILKSLKKSFPTVSDDRLRNLIEDKILPKDLKLKRAVDENSESFQLHRGLNMLSPKGEDSDQNLNSKEYKNLIDFTKDIGIYETLKDNIIKNDASAFNYNRGLKTIEKKLKQLESPTPIETLQGKVIRPYYYKLALDKIKEETGLDYLEDVRPNNNGRLVLREDSLHKLKNPANPDQAISKAQNIIDRYEKSFQVLQNVSQSMEGRVKYLLKLNNKKRSSNTKNKEMQNIQKNNESKPNANKQILQKLLKMLGK